LVADSKPVAFMYDTRDNGVEVRNALITSEDAGHALRPETTNVRALYMRPQRRWVWLTDDDILELATGWQSCHTLKDFIRTVEQTVMVRNT
jgi:hypothetical protein